MGNAFWIVLGFLTTVFWGFSIGVMASLIAWLLGKRRVYSKTGRRYLVRWAEREIATDAILLTLIALGATFSIWWYSTAYGADPLCLLVALSVGMVAGAGGYTSNLSGR
ncbi:MAG: hypothetical protein GXN93_03830 [Candidatus Diapherotrites archaeon]|nr:hypothetical protein [Candidatus Diapherotrites archaeon]